MGKNKDMLQGFKQEVASEMGVPLKQGYNGDLTARQVGSIGGEMVKRMIESQENLMRGQGSSMSGQSSSMSGQSSSMGGQQSSMSVQQ